MRPLTLLSLLWLPALANAHPGHGTEVGFIAGAIHPFTGIDHALGILAAGCLLGWLPAPKRWFIGAAFLGLLGASHAMWTPEAAHSGYITGLLLITAVLVAAGMTATRLFRVTASAAR